MNKIYFDDNEYYLAENYVEADDNKLVATLVMGSKTFDEICNETPCEIARIEDEAGVTTSRYTGFNTLKTAEFMKDYSFDDPNGSGERITEDVVKITLGKRAVTDRLTDIEETIDLLAEAILG